MRQRSLYAAAFVALTGCSVGTGADDRIFTLYRGSTTDPNMRIHIASFDANEKEEYNRENCEIARQLFQAQPGVKVKYWCEKGRYRK